MLQEYANASSISTWAAWAAQTWDRSLETSSRLPSYPFDRLRGDHHDLDCGPDAYKDSN